MAHQQQIFSLDVTALSDQLDLSESELLAGLNGKSPSTASAHVHAKRASVTPVTAHGMSGHINSSANATPTANAFGYTVCLVVSERAALNQMTDRSFSVLELSLRRLFVHPPCARILVCVTDTRLKAEVDAIVRACKRCALTLTTAGSTIDILHGDQHEVEAVRHACMYVDATSAIHSTAPLVVIRASTRVFEVRTVGLLVGELLHASNGRTRAVVLLEDAAPVGLWVCSTAALLRHCEETESNQQEDLNTAIDVWLPSVLGARHCENVAASAHLNWEEMSPDGRTLSHRFQPVPQDELLHRDHGLSKEDEELLPQAEAQDPSALSMIRAELKDDGISAALFKIPTSVTTQKPTSESTMWTTSPTRTDETTPLLLSSPSQASETTVLSEIDLEMADLPQHPNTSAQAYFIQVDRARELNKTAKATTELIMALPDDSTDVLSHGSEGSGDEEDESSVRVPQRQRDPDSLPSSVTTITLEAVVLEPHTTTTTTTAAASKRHGGGVSVSQSRRVSVILHVQKQVPVVGYLILVSALFAVSSQGAVLDLLVGVPPLLKLFWRMSGVSLALLPFAALSMHRKGLPQLAPDKKGLALLCVLSYAAYNATFLIALSLTSIGHVYIFGNSHSLIMVAGKLVLGHPLGSLELLGAALGFSGGVLTTTDRGGSSEPVSSKVEEGRAGVEMKVPSIQGDLVAFAGAFAGVSYLLCAKKLRAALGVRVFLFLLTTGVWLLLLPVLVLNHEMLGIALAEPTHPQRGLLGWIHHLDIEAYIVVVGSVCGTMGFIASMKYFDPLVVSVTMLTEPVVATVFSIFVGVERVPGWPTFVGGLTVILGCLLVLLASHKTSTTVDVSDRLVRTPFTSATSVLRRRNSVAGAAVVGSEPGRRKSRIGMYGSLT